MITLYSFCGLSFVLWLYCRICFFVLRLPTQNFWRFLRSSLTPGLGAAVAAIDIAIKASVILFVIHTLWLRF